MKSDAAIAEYVKSHLRVFGLYAISFVLVAVYWMKHVEHFGHYRDTTPGFLWLQVLYLMFVAVVPIANTMNSLFAGSFAVHAAYAANIFFIGIFSYLAWDYSTRGHRLVDPDLEKATIDGVRHEALVEPSVAFLSIPTAAFSTAAAELLFLLIPVVFLIQKRRRRTAR